MYRLYFIVFLFVVLMLITSIIKYGGKIQLARNTRTTGCIVICILTLVLAFFSAIYTTTDQEIGFVNQFGINTMFEKTGLKVKTPFISTAHVFDGTTQSMTIGYIETSEDSEEYTVIDDESLMITSDMNFIEIDFYEEYRINDPIEFYYATSDPIAILRNCTLTAIKNNVGLTPVDSVMTTGKAELEARISEDIIEELLQHTTGLEFLKINVQDVSLPNKEVKDAFDEVENAKQTAQKKKNQADEYKNTQIPQAQAQASTILAAAEATRTEQINKAEAEVSTFEALWKQFRSSDVVKEKMYYDTINTVLPNMEIIISPDGKMVYVKGTQDNINAVGTAGLSD